MAFNYNTIQGKFYGKEQKNNDANGSNKSR